MVHNPAMITTLKGISNLKFRCHPTGQIIHCAIDDFTDPEEAIWNHNNPTRLWWAPHCLVGLEPSAGKKIRCSQTRQSWSWPVKHREESCNLTTILEEIVDTFDLLGIGRFYFLGKSISGMLRNALAVRFPHHLYLLVICFSSSHLT